MKVENGLNKGRKSHRSDEGENDYMEKLDKVPLRSPSEGSLPKEYEEVFGSKRGEADQEPKRSEKASVQATAPQSQRQKLEQENQIDTADMLYTKQELDMLKQLSPEDQAQIMK